MNREPGSNPFERSQINQLRQLNPRYLRFLTGALSMSMIYGAFAGQEASQWYIDAHTVLTEQADREDQPKPSKPPRGKARRIGGFALGNT